MSGAEPELRIVEDPASEVAGMLAEVAGAGGHLVLTGGSTPERAYVMAAGWGADWRGATVWFGDERCVPPDHPDSNYGMAERALLSRLENPPRAMRMQGELGPDAGAGDYEAEIRSVLGSDPRWDLLLLGMGPDGHVASLFPGKPEVSVTGRLCVGVPLAGLEPQVPRISLTLPAINGARSVVFLITGESKARAVARAFGPDPDRTLPAALARPTAGSALVLLDAAAAAEL
ncbi:MAG: 6-phosphogluconolactonase [Solirubrobacteraceae bacterium]|nr:6-phosphogluconolactonase [Solirubrobacteraceae bacterium]